MSADVGREKAQEILWDRWEKISEAEPADLVEDKELEDAIRRSVNSKTLSFRYAIITQVLAKATNSSVDCRCLQKKRGGRGAFDARSLCKKVIVDFDRKNENVLGGSGDPYVSKPLRHKEISERYRDEIKDKTGWDTLCHVLNRVEEEDDPLFTMKVLSQIILEIKRRLSEIMVTYPTPKRISLVQAVSLVRDYVSEPSEGARPEIIAYSLFKTLGEVYGEYTEVTLSKTTAANHFLHRVANIECLNCEGRIVKAVEPKDRELRKGDVEERIPKIREKAVFEFMFITTKGMKEDDEEDIKRLINTEFRSGYNIYIADLVRLCETMLSLLGEKGRRRFVENTSKTLEEDKYPYNHRKKWSDLLKKIVVG